MKALFDTDTQAWPGSRILSCKCLSSCWLFYDFCCSVRHWG